MAVSDEIIISRIAAGEALAMRVLFARHHTRVYRWLVRMVRDSVLAEDSSAKYLLMCGGRPAHSPAGPR